MKQLSRFMDVFLTRWFDWKRRDTRDAIGLLALGMITFLLADAYDLPPRLLQFGLDYADWEMDDLIFVVFMLSAAMMIYGFRRYQDLSREIKARTAALTMGRSLLLHVLGCAPGATLPSLDAPGAGWVCASAPPAGQRENAGGSQDDFLQGSTPQKGSAAAACGELAMSANWQYRRSLIR